MWVLLAADAVANGVASNISSLPQWEADDLPEPGLFIRCGPLKSELKALARSLSQWRGDNGLC